MSHDIFLIKGEKRWKCRQRWRERNWRNWRYRKENEWHTNPKTAGRLASRPREKGSPEQARRDLAAPQGTKEKEMERLWEPWDKDISQKKEFWNFITDGMYAIIDFRNTGVYIESWLNWNPGGFGEKFHQKTRVQSSAECRMLRLGLGCGKSV